MPPGHIEPPEPLPPARSEGFDPLDGAIAPVETEVQQSGEFPPVGREKVDPLVTADERIEKMVGDWTTFLAESDVDEYLCEIRKESATGRPLGDERFMLKIENKLKRNLKRGKPGRPRKRKRR